jgi:hypothetical protein
MRCCVLGDLVLSELRMPKNASLVPRQPYDVAVYIVLDDFGPKLGRAYRETDEAAANENTIVQNIIAGQYSNPVRVVAFNTEEGWSRDVSEDIARAVVERLQGEGRSMPANGVRRFIERQLKFHG